MLSLCLVKPNSSHIVEDLIQSSQASSRDQLTLHLDGFKGPQFITFLVYDPPVCEIKQSRQQH